MTLYLDEAATTKPKQEVIDAMTPYLTAKWHNPSSLYKNAVDVRADMEHARKVVAKFINADSDEIFFTSGGSESNCWAIQGFINERLADKRIPAIITTEIEHHSILECVDNTPLAIVYKLTVDEYGFVDVQELREVMFSAIKNHNITAKDILVSIQLANNEIGTIQRMSKIVKAVRSYGAKIHTDAVQAFGHIPIDVKNLGVDMLSASGHKIGAPKGIGILYKKKDMRIKPLIYGTQMDGMRGGTENVPYIIGMAKAVELAKDDIDNRKNIVRTRNHFIEELKKIGCSLNGSDRNRLPNNINVVLPDNVSAESVLYTMDLGDVEIGSGSACNSRLVELSHVLVSIGKVNEANSSIRITFPSDITYTEIDSVVRELERSINLVKGE